MLRPFFCVHMCGWCASNHADAGPSSYDFRGTCPLYFPHLIRIPESVYPLVTYVLWRCDFTFVHGRFTDYSPLPSVLPKAVLRLLQLMHPDVDRTRLLRGRR